MKTQYTIKEISDLYNIGVDSIRYYEEKGLITPERGSNNYRYYGLSDIFKLNIIRDLLNLQFSTDQIKAYMDALNVESTITLYTAESHRIEMEIERLKKVGEGLQRRAHDLNAYRNVSVGVVNLKQYERRYGYALESHMRSDEETDYVIKELHQKHKHKLDSLSSLEIGAIPSYEDTKPDTFQSVFFIDPEAKDDYDFFFEAGQYLSLYYRGPYTQSSKVFDHLMEYARKHGYQTNQKPFEIYHIDNRFTAEPSEFLTEVQVFIIEGNVKEI